MSQAGQMAIQTLTGLSEAAQREAADRADREVPLYGPAPEEEDEPIDEGMFHP